MLQIRRKEFSKIGQFVTGHNYLNYHTSNIDPTQVPTCRLCGDSKEEAWHLASVCPVLNTARAQAFLSHFLEDVPKWNVKQLNSFLSGEKVSQLMAKRG